ncbi:MAG: HAMP domain-containing histidine kinase [Firmicutes bacterium]|nr:HAMP domain-containing histidine kinase [Bacillota bacterium]
MFKVLKNPEVKKEFIIYVVLSFAAGLGGFAMRALYAISNGLSGRIVREISGFTGLAVLFTGILFSLIHLLFSAKRYQKISDLSESLDHILHGNEAVIISGSGEGELAVLSSEIQKMTTTLKEQTDLLRSDKIRLTDAIADIFHQIRTPLTSMNLVVTLLSDEDLEYGRRVQLTRELKKQLERIQWLIESLLKLSKIDAGTAVFTSEEVSVKKLIEKASEAFLIPMELRGQQLNVSAGDERFTGDLQWSVEALGNILKNAMEHTPEGGNISVSSSETALYTEIVVEDSGEGFDIDDIPHLFERFYKGKNAGESSIGIGLALSRAIITSQNGIIKAENSPEGGARFVIRFYKNIV